MDLHPQRARSHYNWLPGQHTLPTTAAQSELPNTGLLTLPDDCIATSWECLLSRLSASLSQTNHLSNALPFQLYSHSSAVSSQVSTNCCSNAKNLQSRALKTNLHSSTGRTWRFQQRTPTSLYKLYHIYKFLSLSLWICFSPLPLASPLLFLLSSHHLCNSVSPLV